MNNETVNSPSGHYSPLRYPGGKGKLAPFMQALIQHNGLSDGLYVEPFAGGAGIAWELLLTGIVRKVAVNDISRPVYAFWKCVLDQTDSLVDLICRTPITVDERDKAKTILNNSAGYGDLELGFSAFFLNRTNRSGILNGGMIGGRAQTGKWKLDARFNKTELIRRIEAISSMRRRVTLTNMDAVEFVAMKSAEWKSNTLVYLDPPYFEKGRHLYYDFYQPQDHHGISAMMADLRHVSWVVSYDNVPQIRDIYRRYSRLTYSIGYSARDYVVGKEAMFFSPNLVIPRVREEKLGCSMKACRLVMAKAS